SGRVIRGSSARAIGERALDEPAHRVVAETGRSPGPVSGSDLAALGVVVGGFAGPVRVDGADEEVELVVLESGRIPQGIGSAGLLARRGVRRSGDAPLGVGRLDAAVEGVIGEAPDDGLGRPSTTRVVDSVNRLL